MGYIIAFLLRALVTGMAAGAMMQAMRWTETRPGWVAVPLKPTSRMLNAACKAMSPGARPTQKWVSVKKKHEIRYRAMIDAAK